MRSKIILAVVFVSVVVVAVLLGRVENQSRGRGGPSFPASAIGAQPAAGGEIIGSGSVTFMSGDKVVNIPAAPEDPDFQNWISNEAKSVDQAGLDSVKKNQEMAKVAAEITPPKARQLLQTVQNPQSGAAERILSAYLLVEAGTRAQGELRQLITAPVANPGPYEPHSEAEVRGEQERSLRMMALDGLISRAEHDSSARDVLERTISDIPDPYIKTYAAKRLHEISTR